MRVASPVGSGFAHRPTAGAGENGTAVMLHAFEGAASPAPSTDSDAAALYRSHCASCHGTEGRGDGPDAPFLASRPRNLRDPSATTSAKGSGPGR